MALPVDDVSQSQPDLPVSWFQRLREARGLLIMLAAVFVYFANQWPDSHASLLGAYFLLAGVIAFTRGRPASVRPVLQHAPVERRSRPIWPETQAKLFVNAMPEPCLVLDGEGIVRHSNGAMREVFGAISQGDPLSLKFRDPDIVAALARVQSAGAPVSVPHMIRFPTERHYLIYFSPITLPGPREVNKEIIQHAMQRERGYGEGPDFIFVVMLEQTERFRLNELRSDFIANVSHELRTPIASLTGFIETLLGPARDDAVSRERFLLIMLEQAQRMARLVNDLLSLSRIEMRSHLRPTDQVDLSSVIRHVVDALSPLARDAALRFDLAIAKGAFQVTGDRDELVQVVQNLVENACKYGSDGKKIEISLLETSLPAGFLSKYSTCYMIEVRDYGKGISSEHLPRLTERFYRVDADESKRKMGTGLGLAVVKHILMRHQAYMQVTSKVGAGTSFRVYFHKKDEN